MGSMKAGGPPRRRAARMATQLEGTLSGRTLRGITVRDLSATGCLVHCDALLEGGSIHDLCLHLGEDPFKAKVRVTESSVDGASLPEEVRRYLVGLEFMGLPAQDATRLRQF